MSRKICNDEPNECPLWDFEWNNCNLDYDTTWNDALYCNCSDACGLVIIVTKDKGIFRPRTTDGGGGWEGGWDQ
jgi:hypothetical protein